MAIKTVYRLADDDGNVFLRATARSDNSWIGQNIVKLTYTPVDGEDTVIELDGDDAEHLAEALKELATR
jgi:hypothetical protein